MSAACPVRKVLTCRELVLAGTALTAAAYVPPAWGRLVGEKAFVGPGTFGDGVASGEPTPDGMTFWGRLTTERQRSGAKLIVAEDEGLTRTVATAIVPTGRAIDGSMKTRVTGLKPNRFYFYFYVWQSADEVSPMGRTKTAPAVDSDVPLNLAYSPCQNYPVGVFNGHREAAAIDDLSGPGVRLASPAARRRASPCEVGASRSWCSDSSAAALRASRRSLSAR
ncbi:MAG: PhoD-like phosphatase N-terminal domain-containing protein [Solirubrobacterales bacterium]|nr:PhoD-like phosphatase N-terminal domain-containing protein [Solirubrobacterales bacterium]